MPAGLLHPHHGTPSSVAFGDTFSPWEKGARVTANTASGAAIGYAPQLAWRRRLFAGSVGPVLVVCLAILALWYIGSILLNAPFAREKLARADPLYSTADLIAA